ncbi:hypothetical protein CDAR_555851 [Caerostris darwini]|uniref:Uncharacterized protein n=1 Tax=Caerostris darwini TaxID=1538125 RepID=A0AAV4NDL2_9ARAC|nr:hypothetical protein CDAR_555851 [Caerostris darwini]
MSFPSQQTTLQPTWGNSLIFFLWSNGENVTIYARGSYPRKRISSRTATNGEVFRGENAAIYARGSDPRKRISSRRATNGEALLVGETIKKDPGSSLDHKGTKNSWNPRIDHHYMSSSSEQMTLLPSWGNSLIPFSLVLGENATIYARGSDPRKRISSRRATNGEVLDKEILKSSNRPPLNVFSEPAHDSAVNSGELFNPFFFGLVENAAIYARGSDPRKRISSEREQLMERFC